MMVDTDALDRLQVLLTQEATHYVTSDYLNRWPKQTSSSPSNPTSASAVSSISSSNTSPNSKKRKSLLANNDKNFISTFYTCDSNESYPKRHKNGSAFTAGSGQKGPSSSSESMNTHWREKICEWSYQGKGLDGSWSSMDSLMYFKFSLSLNGFLPNQQSLIISI
jgi:hypothetical protein